MEMPISVMIMLFIAILVGVAIVGFANTTLQRASDGLTELDGVDAVRFDERLVEVSSWSTGMIQGLGGQCLRDFKGIVHRELCFIIRGPQITNTAVINDLHDESISVDGLDWEFDVDITGQPNALFMHYSPSRGKIEIRS